MIYTEEEDPADANFMHFDASLESIDFTPSSDASAPAACPPEPAPSLHVPLKGRPGADSDRSSGSTGL
jgi:hypothetical protein